MPDSQANDQVSRRDKAGNTNKSEMDEMPSTAPRIYRPPDRDERST